MRFARTTEQIAFADALDGMLSAAGVPGVARDWARGEFGPGLGLWEQLGIAGLLVPEALGGLGAAATDVAVAFERLGHHAVPGPWVETAVFAPGLLEAVGDPDGLLPGVADGKVCLSVAVPPLAPYAVDAGAVGAPGRNFLVQEGKLWTAEVAAEFASVDPARRPARLARRSDIGTVEQKTLDRAGDLAATACAAQLLGCGERMLAEALDYVGVRRQFGRAVGEYQAVKHLLADVRVALDFVAPLVHGAALALDADSPDAGRSVSAAKVAAGDAAYLAARTALQVHGAIGYTLEHDLSLWFTKVRALVGAWGTPSWHRGRILRELTGGGSCASR